MKEILYTLLMIALILGIVVLAAAIAQQIMGTPYWQEFSDWMRFLWYMGGGG